jgi:glutamyl-tRNA synthetase
MLFGCTCSRKEIMAAAPDGLYRGTCSEKNLPLHTTGIAWRINTQTAGLVTFNDQMLGPVQVDLHRLMPYFVVRKKDGDPAYQVASLADDLHWNINLMVRGNDLLHSTAAQLFLANCAGINDFAQTTFLHHALLTGAHQEKLSKSAGSFSVRAMRRSGAKAADVVALIASHLGLGERHCGSLDDLLDAFSESDLAQKLAPASW